MASSGDESLESPGRRRVLSTGGTLAGLAVAGCLGDSRTPVRVLAAGSLAHTFEDHVGPAFAEQTAYEIHGEYYGANAVMRFVEDRTKHPDVIISADATLLRDRLYGDVTDWDVEFATNSVGLSYNPDTAFGEALEEGTPWHELVMDLEAGELAIGDPNLDPLGYRAVQAFELAEAEYDREGFAESVLETVYEEPDEPQLLAGVETGSRAAAVVYRNMAVDYGLPFLEFPDAYNFAAPELTDHYSTVEYTTDEEAYTAVGRPVIYNATVHDGADEPTGGHECIAFLLENPDLLSTAGLTVGDSMPQSHGNPPEELER